jgi:hypothetical protein
MRFKTVRIFVFAVFAAVATTFGTAAKAVPISLAFDPLTFAGILSLDVSPTCLATDGVQTCAIDFLSVDFTDVLGNHWVTGTPFSGTNLVEVIGGQFSGLQATLTAPFLALTGDSNGCRGTQQLIFELPGEGNDLQNIVSFSCNGVVDPGNIGIYTVVPEPGTLALLGLGLAGLARSRRRNVN